MAGDYLIFDRKTKGIEFSGFTYNGEEWIQRGQGTVVRVDRFCEVIKPHFEPSPLFFSVNVDFVIVSSLYITQLKLIKKYGFSVTFNPGYAWDYVKFQCPFTNETLCREIQCIRNGERFLVNGEAQEVQSFLVPYIDSPKERFDIETPLKDELDSIDLRNTVFHLSAGLDSSLLVLLAAKLNKGDVVRAVSCETLGRGLSDELEIVKRLSVDYNIDTTIFNFNDVDIFQAGKKLMEFMGFPTGHPSHLVEYLMDCEVSIDFDTIVSGRGPDEVLGGYEWHGRNYANPDRWQDRITVTHDETLNQLFRPQFERRQDNANRYVRGLSKSEMTVKSRLQYDIWSVFESWRIIHSSLSEGLGIDIKTPFQKSDLMGGLMMLPDDYHIRGVEHKWILRDCFRDIYPDYLLSAPKRGMRFDLQPYLVKYDRRELRDLLYGHSEFASLYLEVDYIDTMIDLTLNGEKNFGWQLWSIYLSSLGHDLLFSN